MADLETLKEIERLKGFCKEGGVRSTILYAGEEIVKLRRERDGLKTLIGKAVDRLYEIAIKHGGDIEGVTRGRITACATRLNKQAIALAEGGEQ